MGGAAGLPAYLWAMAVEVVAKRDGISIEAAAKIIAARDPQKRAAVMAEAVGVKPEVSVAAKALHARANRQPSDGKALMAALESGPRGRGSRRNTEA